MPTQRLNSSTAKLVNLTDVPCRL